MSDNEELFNALDKLREGMESISDLRRSFQTAQRHLLEAKKKYSEAFDFVDSIKEQDKSFGEKYQKLKEEVSSTKKQIEAIRTSEEKYAIFEKGFELLQLAISEVSDEFKRMCMHSDALMRLIEKSTSTKEWISISETISESVSQLERLQVMPDAIKAIVETLQEVKDVKGLVVSLKKELPSVETQLQEIGSRAFVVGDALKRTNDQMPQIENFASVLKSTENAVLSLKKDSYNLVDDMKVLSNSSIMQDLQSRIGSVQSVVVSIQNQVSELLLKKTKEQTSERRRKRVINTVIIGLLLLILLMLGLVFYKMIANG